jgi:hypothetical protein
MSESGGAAVTTSRRGQQNKLHAPCTALVVLLWASNALAAESALTIEPRPRRAPEESKVGGGKPAPKPTPAVPDAGPGTATPERSGSSKSSPEPADTETKPKAPESEATESDATEPTEPNDAGTETKPNAPEPEAEKLPHGIAVDDEGLKLVAAHFRATSENMTLLLGPDREQHRDTGWVAEELDTDELQALCVAPCARWLYPGSYSVALARGKEPVRVSIPLSIDTPALLEGEYHSYAWMRVTGYVTMGAGVLLGSLLVFSSVDDCGSTDGSCLQKEANVFIGAGVMLAGLTGGLLMTQKSDEVSVAVRPLPKNLPEPP